MPTVTGRVYEIGGGPVSGSQRMQWYKGGSLIKDFYTEADGDYCVVLASGTYCVVIATKASNPATYTVTSVPLQTRNFNKTNTTPNCITFLGTMKDAEGQPITGESQFMQWIGENDAVVAEFWTPPDGIYAIRLPYGSYRTKINGVEVYPDVGEAAIDPCGSSETGSQTLNFTVDIMLERKVKPAIAPTWPPPVKRNKKGEICVCVSCGDSTTHTIDVSGTGGNAEGGAGKHCVCVKDKPKGKHKIKVNGHEVGEVEANEDYTWVKVACPDHRLSPASRPAGKKPPKKAPPKKKAAPKKKAK